MSAVVAESELFRSCEILFGLELNLSRDFLEYLQHTGVKSAYRKKAMETHPDLAAGKSEQERKALAQVFHGVQEAYENLKAYLDAREKGYRIPAGPPGRAGGQDRRHGDGRRSSAQRTAGGRERARREFHCKGGASDYARSRRKSQRPAVETENLYQGPVPNRKLLFGHYLYYCGAINWRCIIQALVWQRMQRPRLGELGKKLGWLSEKEVRRIMEYRTPFQPFGECAVKLGILTEQQRTVLVNQQKRLQKKIGNYFVENRIISQQMLERYLDRYRSHNASMKNGAPSSWYTC